MSARVVAISKYIIVFKPILPRFFTSPCPAIPTTSVAKISGAGVPMSFPNIYVQQGLTQTVDPSAFLDGTTFSVTVDDPSVAGVGTAGASGSHGKTGEGAGPFTFFGLKSGSTTATITPAGGAAQTFVITVRTSGSGSGWL